MIISRTPTRISLLGGGTDYPEWFEDNGGAILGTSINLYCYVCLHDGKCYHFFDVPTKSGLGTSSAYTVGLLRACTNYDNETIAKLAIQWERDKLNGNVGYQDQYLCSIGGFHLLHFDAGGIMDTPIEANELNDYLMLFDTHLYRTGGRIISYQLKRIKQNKSALGEMASMAKEGMGLLSQKKYDDFGRMLNNAWELKKSLDKHISTPFIDTLYSSALKAGALGGKLLGAGGGGFLLIFAHPEDQPYIKKSLNETTYVPFKFEREGSVVIYNEEASRDN